MDNFKHFSGTIVIDPRTGQPMVTRGFTEIGKMRIYDDQVVIGKDGQLIIRRGEALGVSGFEDWLEPAHAAITKARRDYLNTPADGDG